MGKRGTPTTSNSGRRTLGLECGCRQICIDADAWTLVVIKLCQAKRPPAVLQKDQGQGNRPLNREFAA